MSIKSIGYAVKEELSQEVKNILEKPNNQEKLINYKKLSFTGGNNIDYDFSEYKSLKELFKAIYYRNVNTREAERIQKEFNATINALNKYRPKKDKYSGGRKKLLINAKNFYDGRKMIINAFKNKIFPMTPTNFDEDEFSRSSLDLSRSSLDSPRSSLYLSRSSSPIGATAASPRSISPIDNEVIYPNIIRHYFRFDSLDEIYEFSNKDSVDKDLNATIIDQDLVSLKLYIK